MLCAVVLMITMVASTVFAGGGQQAAPAAARVRSTGPAVKTQPQHYYSPYESPVKVTAGVQIAADIRYRDGENPNNSEWTRAWLNKINIDLEFTLIARNPGDYNTMLNLAIASRTAPDLFLVNFIRYHELLESDFLADMTEGYREWLPPVVKDRIESVPGVIDSISRNGRMYGVPVTVHGGMNVYYARKDWVHNVGLRRSDLRTMDDFIRMSYAFAQQDPNRTGRRDTYGFAMDSSLDSFWRLCTAFGVYPTQWVEQTPGGRIVYGLTQPGMQEALALAIQMFRDGIIDPEFGVKSGADIRLDTNASRIGQTLSGTNNIGFFNTLQPSKNDLELYIWRFPDKAGNDALGQTPATPANVYVATRDCQYPEAFVKLMAFWEHMVNG